MGWRWGPCHGTTGTVVNPVLSYSAVTVIHLSLISGTATLDHSPDATRAPRPNTTQRMLTAATQRPTLWAGRKTCSFKKQFYLFQTNRYNKINK